MFDSTFAAAYIDNGNRHRLLGVTVRPFCLWHLLLLQVIKSPFLSSGDVTLFDLKTAIGICRLRYHQSRVKRPLLPLVRFSKKKLKAEVIKFLEYVGDYLNRPEYNIISLDLGSSKTSSKSICPAPEVVMAAYDAAEGARVSIREAWEMPIGEAYISQAMYLRREGLQVDFMDDSEREFQNQMKAQGY